MSSTSYAATHLRRRIAENLKRVRERIAAAAARCGRGPDSVQLVAVTKTVDLEVVKHLIELGQTELGESRVQQLVKRASLIEEQMQRRAAAGNEIAGPIRWHMVGQLQRNKARAVLPLAAVIHSIDTLRLAEEVSARAEKLGAAPEVLVQVNVSGEKSKSGMPVAAVPYLIEQIVTLPHIRVGGLMTMAPLVADPERTRSVFARLREIFEDIGAGHRVGPEFRHLSMGMSNDFEVAIEEGATIVRIGTTLFEGIAPAVTDPAAGDDDPGD